jgi:cytochrome oxidase Cu insertion factor (SCO1/SenC/PrrC family)
MGVVAFLTLCTDICPLDTGNLLQVEHFFGWYVRRVPEDTPPSLDWWTGKPLTYDVTHSDGFVIIDAQGTERFSTGAAPVFQGALNPTLHRFLNPQGRSHLAHPLTPGWTPTAALDALGWLVHKPLPVAGN